MAQPTIDEATASSLASKRHDAVLGGDTVPLVAVSAIAMQKKPPPETPDAIRLRMLVIASFWAIVLFLGLPIWWRTTTVYRANLPLKQMNDWAGGQICRPVFPLQISIEAAALSEQEAQLLLHTTQHAIDDLNDFSAHHLRLQLSPSSNSSMAISGYSTGSAPIAEEVALLIKLIPGQTTNAVLQPYEPTLNIYYIPNQSAASFSAVPLANYIANQLREIFQEEQQMIAYLLATSSSPVERSLKTFSPEVTDALAKRTTRSLNYARTYHLTFSLFTPSATPSSWDIEAALEDYIKPLLVSFSTISDFTIDTQIQLYASPGIHSSPLPRSELSNFINAAEWPLSPSISGAPTINFILYIGDMEVEGGGKSWLIPQWGGVVIQPDVHDLRPAMLTFSKQLFALLGAPDRGSLPLRIMTLVRVRSAELLLKASGTLGSLARLTLALPSIPIPETVAEGVQTTLEHLEKACGRLGGKEGLDHARVAEEAAEKAFFEKSMVGQVYFPDEHKYAVYLPLLGQMVMPLTISVVKELRAWKARREGIL